MDNNINILDELNKGCFMGIDALDYIIPICSENSFLELLNKQCSLIYLQLLNQ